MDYGDFLESEGIEPRQSMTEEVMQHDKLIRNSKLIMKAGGVMEFGAVATGNGHLFIGGLALLGGGLGAWALGYNRLMRESTIDFGD